MLLIVFGNNGRIKLKRKINKSNGHICLIRLGSEDRPASPEDIAHTKKMLEQNPIAPDLTIVTHHLFDLKFIEIPKDWNYKTAITNQKLTKNKKGGNRVDSFTYVSL